MPPIRTGCLAALALAVTLAPPARAVIVYPGTGDVAFRNTTEPTGPLAGSGWQYQGRLFNVDSNGNVNSPFEFAATVIAPNFIIAARHTGGNRFEYNGVVYNIRASNVPMPSLGEAASDLAIYELRIDNDHPALTDFAPIYFGNDEVGRNSVFFGRGADPGPAVFADGQLKGFRWGNNIDPNFDHSLSWGQNVLDGVFEDPNAPGAQYLFYDFSRSGLPNEGIFTGGDSGGGLFINVNGTWMLAGVNVAVDPTTFALPRTNDPTRPGDPFQASMLDFGGLFVETSPGVFTFVPDENDDLPSFGFAARLSANAQFIRRVTGLAVPEPASLAITGVGLALVVGATRLRRRKAGFGR